MSDYSTSRVSPPPLVNDFSPNSTRENELPPSYTSIINNSNNIHPKSDQYQFQFGTTRNVIHTQNMSNVSTSFNQELNNIENYKVWSIINIIFCCLCLGCVACFYSVETDDAKLRGDIQGALNASRNARTINIVATILGIIILIIYVLIQMNTF